MQKMQKDKKKNYFDGFYDGKVCKISFECNIRRAAIITLYSDFL